MKDSITDQEVMLLENRTVLEQLEADPFEGVITEEIVLLDVMRLDLADRAALSDDHAARVNRKPMDHDTDEEVSESEEPIIDATDLIIGQTILDDEDYDELIILDLRTRDRHDAWLC
jgi:hypothetical protein